MDNLLRRKVDTYLKDRKNSPDRKPLIIKGVRQIGKTRSIEYFEESKDSKTGEYSLRFPVLKYVYEYGPRRLSAHFYVLCSILIYPNIILNSY